MIRGSINEDLFNLPRKDLCERAISCRILFIKKMSAGKIGL
jgi:hypothetical protein